MAYWAELAPGEPLAVDLLGEALVLWRNSAGTAHAFFDLCIHRGTALSLGTVEGDEIVCPYHGWRYGSDGACTRIPQRADPTRVPAKARATTFTCAERYGMIWVALEEPRWGLPEVPELEDPAWATVYCGPYWWACDASRQVENFTDFGHFPFVHPGLLGDPERPVVPGHEVSTDGHILRYEIVRPEAHPPMRSSRCSATRSSNRPSGAAATSCTCRTRSSSASAGVARQAWSTSSPAGPRGRTGRRAFSRSAATTPSSSPTRCCRSSRT